MRKRIFLIFLLASVTVVYPAKRKRAAAVVPFQNTTGSKGLDFLSQALADSVQNSIPQTDHLRLVERRQLKAVLKEMELMQQGLTDDSHVQINAAKVPAEFIIAGSYTGTSQELTVTVRAIDVTSGTVAASRKVTGPVDSIFSQLDAVLPGFLAALSGEGLAELTIFSEPQGASVYLDGNPIGQTPIVAFKVVAGKHNLKLVKQDYREVEQTVENKTGDSHKLEIPLTETSYRNRPYMDLGAYWFNPFSNFSKSAPLGAVGIGHSFRQFLIKFEFSAPAITSYTYSYRVPYSQLEDTRKYAFYMFHAGFNYHPFEWTSVSPYVGVQLGYTRILESEINKTLYAVNNDKRIINGFTGIAVLGFDFFPTARLMLFAEARYYTSVLLLDRNDVESISFLGTTQIADKSFRLSAMGIGAGLRVRF